MKQDTLLKYILEDVLKKTNDELASELITHVDTEADSIEVFQKPIKVTDTEYLIKKEHINTFQCYFELKFEDELNIGKIIDIQQLHDDVFRITLKEEERICPPHQSNTNLELEKAMGIDKHTHVPGQDTVIEETASADNNPGFQGDYLQNIINSAKSGASSVSKEAFVEKNPIHITLPPVTVEEDGTGIPSDETVEDIIGGVGSNLNQSDLPGWQPKKESFEDLPDTPINLGATGTGTGLESIAPKSAEPASDGFDVRKLVMNTEKTTNEQVTNDTPPVTPTPEVVDAAYRIYVGKGESYAGFDLPPNIEERKTSIDNVMMSAFQAGEDVCIPINNALDFLQTGNIPLVINDQALLTRIADPDLGEKPCVRLELKEGRYDIVVSKN